MEVSDNEKYWNGSTMQNLSVAKYLSEEILIIILPCNKYTLPPSKTVSARKFYLRAKVAPDNLFRGQFFFSKWAKKLKANEGKMLQGTKENKAVFKGL